MANPDYENARSLRRQTDRLKVFISYSRHDSRLAAEIVGGLEFDGGFETLIDSHSMEEGEEWKAHLSTHRRMWHVHRRPVGELGSLANLPVGA